MGRLDEYMKLHGLTDYRVEKDAGLGNGLIGKARTKGGGLQIEIIERILSAYPRLNAAWLLAGVGTRERTPFPSEEAERISAANHLPPKYLPDYMANDLTHGRGRPSVDQWMIGVEERLSALEAKRPPKKKAT